MSIRASLTLDGQSLEPRSLWEAAQTASDPTAQITLAISPDARKRIEKAAGYLEKRLASGQTVYGVNTGFGYFARTRIAPNDLAALQANIIRSHCAGVGESVSRPLALCLWLILLNSSCRGHRGLRVNTVEHCLKALEMGLLAEIPARGSVGASGDLAPSAHAVAVLLGEGSATLPNSGKTGFDRLSSTDALERLKLKPLQLSAKEGLSLINGTQLTTAMAVQLWNEAEQLTRTANLTAAMMIEAMRGSHHIVDEALIMEQRQQGTRACADEIRSWISQETEISHSHEDCDRVQDPYSLRCAPQVHGAVWEDVQQILPLLQNELNSTTDNPLLFPDEDEVIHGGNFHAIYPARMCDRLGSAMATLASISERRIHMAMKKDKSGLPDFLIAEGGLNSGLMMAQTTAAALVSECKSMSFPASVDSISTNNDQEDHVSMGPIAGLKALRIAQNTRYVLAIELIAAAQAIELLRPLKSSPRIEQAHALLRQTVPFLKEDRVLAADIEKAAELIASGALLSI